MIPLMPPELGRPMREGYAFAPGDGRRITPQDDGIPRWRRRFSRAADPLTLLYPWSAWQRALWWRFYREEIAEGSIPFRMRDATRDGWPLLTGGRRRLLTGSGRPILVARTLHVVLGEDPVQETLRGTEFFVTINVMVLP
jgi:hypothetical protein